MNSRQIKIQLAIFALVSVVSGGYMLFDYINLPALWFGVGRYTVTVELRESGGLYQRANVTYRGTEVGRVEAVRIAKSGVEAVLSLRSGVAIPSDLDARVHSENAVGEQYIALLPRNGASPPLKNGDVIPVSRTSVPPDINSLLDATNRGLRAIPQDNLKTAIDEAFLAVGGLGPEIRRFVKGSTGLAIDTRHDLDPLTTVIDQSQPVLDSQTQTSDAISAWAAHLAAVTGQLQTQDGALAGVIEKGGPAAEEGRQLVERLQPTLPIILANLVSVGQVGVTYSADLEQLLVLLPQATSVLEGFIVPNLNTKQAYRGAYLDFNLNLNLPPACTTGFLPVQQMRNPSEVDAPDRPDGDLYCRIPQDAMFNVRGVRNTPCETRPGKRAPTVKLCESDQEYVPLNDGLNWKGDPNATLSGQGIPQLPPGSPPQTAPPPAAAPPPIAAARYDPATGTYIGPDGHVYTQANLAQTAPKEHTWQNMLMPPTGN
ncbi:mammalian cell entry protein [Mycobacterium mantenii]|uniref:Mammalian cell entry protein n=1 Tax=Mycobacterium mantenii TaxID=560555 RepID=A0A1X0FNH8_MYCNT|nr:MlaD family protein [Mycobacterium mantenii]MCV7246498.1 MCE family protein [Mycobacterium mantenii]ORB02860.1 mammalian cell entry protein [Mycobacterium mantenii]BBY38009.1 mammalian cell entry protein [Mycobacterium mantenii]